MIERIVIENFKSFGDKVEIKLNKFNVLVGPNNSGKSNFLDALRFLSEIMNENIDKALNRRGSYKSVVFNGEENREIGFLINARIENSNIEYYLKIVFPANIKEEYLISDGKELIIFKNGKAQLWNIITNSFDTIYYPSSTSQPYPVITSHLRHLRKTEYPLQWKFREILEKIEVYNFDPGKLRQKVKIGKVTKLNSDGSNLSAAIHFLRNKDREAYEELESLLKSAVPEIKYLETPPTEQGEANLEIVEENLNKRIDLSEMSDGILWLLAHIYVFLSPEPPSLVCFEEPSSFVHPRILQILVNIFKSVDAQVIVTTHNPFFVNLVEPEDLIIFEKVEGKTRCKRIENPEEMKKRIIKDIPLGEIWYSGEIGGVPK
ncbi:MAG: AAA family ATPase [Thermoproteota archaeon]|jgi:predicted ATPase|nr:AAA family ATPase [Thermoproteota archaeon]